MIETKVYSIATSGNECVLLLEEVGGPRLLPIWIGLTEGQAIAIKFSGIVLPRPMTHDLLVNAFDELKGKLTRIVINDLRGQTFYAQLWIQHNNKKHMIDSRPSDAVALAVRCNCPIFIEEKVFEKCQTMNKPISEDEVKKFREELQNLRPEDIFKHLKNKPKSEKKEGIKEGPEEPGPEDAEEEQDEEEDS
ncbi:bifunctional nuclease family protein [Elusimicrobiota bacterium]